MSKMSGLPATLWQATEPVDLREPERPSAALSGPQRQTIKVPLQTDARQTGSAALEK
jgi:hypothetical protein